jgi:hypothetical protein
MLSRRSSFARRWLAIALGVMLAVTTASPVLAASDDDETLPDARLTGYEPAIPAVGGGVAFSYALVVVLGAISLGATFKNARRTHLD